MRVLMHSKSIRLDLKNRRGLIFLIQRYSIHDGPGIRTTIFMKGCPLKCRWCQNPESWGFHPELVERDVKCILCGKCVETCSFGFITLDHREGRKIDRDRCNLCFECTAACPTGALSKVGEYMTIEEIMTEIEKDEVVYYRSGGGVTVSGGEPLFQGTFTYELLKVCKERGLHTALDTSGYAPWSILEKVLKYVDLVLYDIKHMNSEFHKNSTEKSNVLILSNLHRIPSSIKVWLRIPLIHGYNDSLENLKKVAVLGKEIKVERVSILPFHKLGGDKVRQLGKQCQLEGIEPPNTQHIQKAKEILETFGLSVTIGE